MLPSGCFEQRLAPLSFPHRGLTAARRHVTRVAAALALMGLARVPLDATDVFPTALPDPQIPGFTYPESEATLTRWVTEMSRSNSPVVAANAFERIHRHGWGLWTALTSETGQIYAGHNVRVFETWLTPEELRSGNFDGIAMLSARPFRRASLRELAPLENAAEPRRAAAEVSRAPATTTIDRVIGFVKFDPTAAEHIVRQRLLHANALDALLEGGAQQIPPFPATALTVKPVFQTIRAQQLVEGRYHALKAWPGPPASPRPWAPAQWPATIWIDVLDGGNGRGKVDTLGMFDGSSRTDETTYPLSSFIHYRLSAADVTLQNERESMPPAAPGDISILVAMHVSGREIARWTWQTFWWSPSPDVPHAPSSAAIAILRPDQLRGPARNYAMALAYTMLSPDQPYVGGRNTAAAVYAYNPWLEARLGPGDLPDSVPGFGPDGLPASNNHGVQTNCMSCHVQANYNPHQRATAPRFTGARYVDLGAAEFVGTLQVDFLWSIARHAR